MRLRKKLMSCMMAAMMVVGSAGITAAAAEIQCDKQIPASEVDSVYNMPVESNSLSGWPAGPNIYSESGIVMDMDSGAILYAKKIDEQHYPASITKILTALVALENSELTDRVKFTWDSIGFLEYGDAHIGMKPDEEISMEDALYGMLLASANEVSYAIADSVEGGYDHFIQMMNQKVEELGGRNSHFMNANGLHHDEHYTSARDMALIGSAVFRYDEFRKITATRQHTIPETAITNEKRTFQQNHKMLFQNNQNYYEYCVGGKTGFTDQALTTLVTFASKDDKNLVCVTLRTHGGGRNAYVDTRAMLDYAFDNFTKVPVTKEMLNNKDIAAVGENAYLMLPSGVSPENTESEFTVSQDLGNKIGTVAYTYGGQEVGKVQVTITDKYYNKLHGIETVKKEEQPKKKVKKIPFVVKVVICIVVLVVGACVTLQCTIMDRRRKKEARRRRARLKSKRKKS